MQYNSHSDSQDIISDITFLTGVGTTKYTLKDRTLSVNGALGIAWAIIFDSYGGWKFMDDNQSDASTGLPYADQTITSGTGLYALPTGTLTVDGAEIKVSASAPLTRLIAMTPEEFLQRGGDAAFPSNGVPLYYMLQGDILRLLPTPNFTLATALRVFFGAGMTNFISTDTTATPGFASVFHRYLSFSASYDWVSVRGPKDKAPGLLNNKLTYEKMMRDFYSKRFLDRFPHHIPPGPDIVELYS